MDNIPAIRVLPMSLDEEEFAGRTVEEMQSQFFLRDLPSRDGEYWYRRAGLDASPGTIVLFQYDNRIIASATLCQVERFEKPKGDFRGTFYFDSIRVFDPIGPEQLGKIWSEFTSFSHAKWSLAPEGYPKFEQQLTEIRLAPRLFPEEVPADLCIEGAVRSVTIDAYERDPEARRRCIEAHGTSCQVCGFNFGEVYGPVVQGYIHVHHLRSLSEIRKEHVVDPIADLRPVCPNCHAVIHRRVPSYSIEEVRAFLRRRPE